MIYLQIYHKKKGWEKDLEPQALPCPWLPEPGPETLFKKEKSGGPSGVKNIDKRVILL
jgi:hypothetical protein